jgi:hypothetical protein
MAEAPLCLEWMRVTYSVLTVLLGVVEFMSLSGSEVLIHRGLYLSAVLMGLEMAIVSNQSFGIDYPGSEVMYSTRIFVVMRNLPPLLYEVVFRPVTTHL